MPLGPIPKKNPGRYFEKFVKVLEPRTGPGMATSPAATYSQGGGATTLSSQTSKNSWMENSTSTWMTADCNKTP